MSAPNNSLVPPPIIPPPSGPIPPLTPPVHGPWSFWATTGWTALIAVIYFCCQVAVTSIFFVLGQIFNPQSSVSAEQLALNGDVLGTAVVLATPVAVGFSIFLARLRNGPSVTDYLALRWPNWKVILVWIFGLLGIVFAIDTATYFAGRPVVPNVMIEVYETTTLKPLLWLALVVGAPLGEEFVFRGFLFRGWQKSRLGNWGTVVATAASWAVVHLQYDVFGIAIIFIAGVMIGWARLRSRSLWLCVLMHAAMNLTATIQIELALHDGAAPEVESLGAAI